jgi:hypothetical protein
MNFSKYFLIVQSQTPFVDFPMKSPRQVDNSSRPAKRKRLSSQKEQETQPDLQCGTNEPNSMTRSKQKVRPSLVKRDSILHLSQATGISMGCSLTGELKQILHSTPQNATMALSMLDLYLCLWEFYVMDSAQKIRLEDEHRLLQDSNGWLLRQNEQLIDNCNCQALLIWDRQQALRDMHQGLAAIIHGSERSPCQQGNLP